MSEQEKALFKQQLREEIEAERREAERIKKQAWRDRNREHIRQYDRAYRLRRKLCQQITGGECFQND